MTLKEFIMEKVLYNTLSINQKINYKSGWDIAIAYEGAKNKQNKPYCKIALCINTVVSTKICDQDYNSQQKHRFLNGGRNLCKTRYTSYNFESH